MSRWPLKPPARWTTTTEPPSGDMTPPASEVEDSRRCRSLNCPRNAAADSTAQTSYRSVPSPYTTAPPSPVTSKSPLDVTSTVSGRPANRPLLSSIGTRRVVQRGEPVLRSCTQSARDVTLGRDQSGPPDSGTRSRTCAVRSTRRKSELPSLEDSTTNQRPFAVGTTHGKNTLSIQTLSRCSPSSVAIQAQILCAPE